ncbi:PqqD family peptide modification chaperone [uncultured Albimonas sp.]|uniref:PqqD family peptide modification chaperone n=1 Tax=uncultured Albimonas sp. TaxID=1331701 RepID=UPI0030EC3571|tara:strand:+ start:1193 stop:3337 length:2145 start_codon:yes stop_codon:yes gene_type:complete
MPRGFLSSDWYRVADLKPRLAAHVEIHRQVFRGGVWHIVQDRHNGRYHRVGPAGNLMLNLMNGRRSVAEIWETACERFEDDPPTQDEVIRLLSQLHSSDLVAGGATPDLDELARRAETQARRNLLMRIRNPMAMRLPLLDPDRFLAATAWLARPIFTVWGFLAWVALLVWGGVVAALNWAPLTSGLADRVLTVENLALVAIAYPLVKTIHELGHAYASKVWGGEVHEVGVMFLVFIPVPYVDASASSAFASKWRRAVVGGAGIMVELALAALAALTWVELEPGLLRAFCFNVMLIGGVSTLFFNGNPLLRFDGYFVMCDLVEIPNLGTRANRHVLNLVQRCAFGRKDIDSVVTARGEAAWFVLYAVAAFVYRLFIAVAISLFVATKFFFIGAALAVWSLSNAFLWPLMKGAWHVVASPALRGRRVRAVSAVGVVLGAIAAGLFAVPLPHASIAQGVVRIEEDRILRAGAGGFVAAVHAPSGKVAAGAPILTLEDPALAAETRLLESRLAEMRLRLRSVLMLDRVQAELFRVQVEHLEARVADIRQRAAALELFAPAAGRVVIRDADRLLGKWLAKGETVGWLLSDEPVVLSIAVPETEAELVRGDTRAVALRFERQLDREIPAAILRAAPEGEARLPSRALSTAAGGPFPTLPSDPDGLATLDVAFRFDVAPLDPLPVEMVGERALLRFDHGLEPLAPRIWRAARQLFLARFNV